MRGERLLNDDADGSGDGPGTGRVWEGRACGRESLEEEDEEEEEGEGWERAAEEALGNFLILSSKGSPSLCRGVGGTVEGPAYP